MVDMDSEHYPDVSLHEGETASEATQGDANGEEETMDTNTTMSKPDSDSIADESTTSIASNTSQEKDLQLPPKMFRSYESPIRTSQFITPSCPSSLEMDTPRTKNNSVSNTLGSGTTASTRHLPDNNNTSGLGTTSNTRHLSGNNQIPTRPPNTNPQTTQGLSLDKPIILKRGVTCRHIHLYDLRIKVKSTKTEDEEQTIIQNTLQKFFEIVLQADKTSIIPAFLELDQNDRAVPDISASLPISEINPFSSVKRYFAQLSQQNDKGNIYCSLILAQNIPFTEFMELARPSLMNMDFGIFPKASDHETLAEVGWMLYSTRSQDKERLAEMMSLLV
jgi:hypothetical protein